MIFYLHPVDSRELHTRTILLADDDEDDRFFFARALQAVSGSIALSSAENGLQVMEMLRPGKNMPDLVFLDLNMPLKNGYECLREIKQHPELLQIPIIIFSTSIQPESVTEVYSCGASLYMVKPNDFSALKQLIQHVLTIDWDRSRRPSRESFILHT